MPQNSVEKSANGILYSIPGRPCTFTEIYMFFFEHVFLAKKIFFVKREMSFGRVNGHGGKSIFCDLKAKLSDEFRPKKSSKTDQYFSRYFT